MGINSVINKAVFEKFQQLHTERLLLRRITESDVKNIFEIYSDPETARFDWYYPIESMDKVTKIIDSFEEGYEEKEEITWGVVRKDDNKLIGYCCLGDFQEGSRSCEIGYGFNREYWNKGYGTEAVQIMVKFAFEEMNINRIAGTVTLGNDASIKVLKKCGFQQEGIFSQRTFMKGEFVDDVILAILMEDYKRATN
ncbi:MAG: GNAT family N-acetyltransferase [Clostridium sp.]